MGTVLPPDDMWEDNWIEPCTQCHREFVVGGYKKADADKLRNVYLTHSFIQDPETHEIHRYCADCVPMQHLATCNVVDLRVACGCAPLRTCRWCDDLHFRANMATMQECDRCYAALRRAIAAFATPETDAAVVVAPSQ